MAEALVSKYVQTQLRALNAALTNGQFVSVRKLLLELPPSDVAALACNPNLLTIVSVF